MSWESPDPTRDEDRYYEDETMVPVALLEISPDASRVLTLGTGSHRGASPRSTPNAERTGSAAWSDAIPSLIPSLRELATKARSEGKSWWLWDDPPKTRGYGPVLAFAHETTPEAVIELLDEIDRLREALERVYQVGRGPHVAIAREALDA